MSFGRGFIWSVVPAALGRGLNLLALLVLARLLAPSAFGTVGAIATFLALIQLGSDLGMKATIVHEQERGTSDRIDSAFTLNVALVLVLTVVGIAVAPAVASFFGLPDEAALFRLASLNLILAGLGNIHDGLLLRDLSFAQRARPQLAMGVVQATVSVVLALLGLGASALVWGMLAGTAVWTIMQWRMTAYRPRLVVDPTVARSMIGYGGAAAALQVIAVVSTRTDAAIVGNQLGAVALGIYTVAFRLPELALSSVAWTLSVVTFPTLSRRRTESHAALVETTLWITRLLALYALPTAVALALLADPLIAMLFSERWAAAAPVLAAVSVTVALTTVIFPLGDASKAIGHQRLMVWLNLLHLPLLIGFMLLATPHGVVGVAWAGAAATVVFVAMFLVSVTRVTGVPLGGLLRAMLPGAVAALGAAAGLLAVQAAWSPAAAWLELVAGGLAALLGALLAVRLGAPGTLGQLLASVRRLPRRPLRPAVESPAPGAGR